jgi:hypothetical protein
MKNSAHLLFASIQETYVGPASPLSHWREHSLLSLLFSMSLCSLPRESPNDITTGNIIRNAHWIRNVHVYHDVFKVGNTAGEYTECSSSPHEKDDPLPFTQKKTAF